MKVCQTISPEVDRVKTDELLYRSIYIITQYYKNDLKPFFDSVSDDVLWLGPAERQMIHGKQELLQTCAGRRTTAAARPAGSAAATAAASVSPWGRT